VVEMGEEVGTGDDVLDAALGAASERGDASDDATEGTQRLPPARRPRGPRRPHPRAGTAAVIDDGCGDGLRENVHDRLL
jgi:hypothetical protein